MPHVTATDMVVRQVVLVAHKVLVAAVVVVFCRVRKHQVTPLQVAVVVAVKQAAAVNTVTAAAAVAGALRAARVATIAAMVQRLMVAARVKPFHGLQVSL